MAMDDEGYTSPTDELDGSKENNTSESIHPEKQPSVFVGSSWDDLRLRKPDSKETETPIKIFLTDSQVSSSGPDFVDAIWRLIPARADSGSLAVIKSSLEQPTYIPLPVFISELFMLLVGKESSCFIYDTGQVHFFTRNPFILVKGLSPTALDNYCQDFIECGGRFRKFFMLSRKGYKDTDLFLMGGNRTMFTSFQKAVGNYLKIYEIILVLNQKSMNTLTKLQFFIQPYHFQLKVLEQIAEFAINKSPLTLLTELNRMMFAQGTPYIEDLLGSIFTVISSTYTTYISDWIFRGELAPSFDFHIKNQLEETYQDRRFWTRQFTESSEIPLFVQESTDLIFQTGKASRLLNLIENIEVEDIDDHDSIPIPIHFSFHSDYYLVLTPCESFNTLRQLTTEWDTKQSHFLANNEHLKQEVQDSISSVISDSTQQIEVDFNVISAARESYENPAPESQNEKFNRKRSYQQKFRQTLQEQVDKSRALKSANEARERKESEINIAFNAKREVEYENEKIKFRQKYFPVPHPELQIPCPQEIPEDSPHLSHKQEDQVKFGKESGRKGAESTAPEDRKLFGIPFKGVRKLTVAERMEENVTLYHTSATPMSKILRDRDVDVVDSGTPVPGTSSSGQVTTRKRNFNKKAERTMEEILGYKQPNRVEESATLTFEEGEERLNPDKFILTKSKAIPKFDPDIFRKKPSKVLVLSVEEKAALNQAQPPREASLLNLIFAQSIAVPVQAQHTMVSTALLHYFVKEQKLFHILAFLNDFVLLQNGVFGQSIATLLINEAKLSPVTSIRDLSDRTGGLNAILDDSLAIAHFNQGVDPLAKGLSFELVRETDILMKELLDFDSGKGKLKSHIYSEFQFLNALRLSYGVGWPLNIIITDDMIHHYECLFGIFMQLSRSEELLKQVFLLLKSKRSKSAQLTKLQFWRHKFLNFVRALRFYMNAVVVRSGWIEFCSPLHQLDSLQNIYDHIVRYVRDISINCFLSFTEKSGGILRLVVRCLAILDSFSSQLMKICGEEGFNWDLGSEIKEEDYSMLRRKHDAAWQFHKMFLITLYKASGKDVLTKIDPFLELHDFNNFYKQQLITEKVQSGRLDPVGKVLEKQPPFKKTTSVPIGQSQKVTPSQLPSETTTSFYL